MHWHPDLLWHRDSPDAGDPACTCSWCGIMIAALDEGPRLTYRFRELRFHLACWEWVATREGLLRPQPLAPEAATDPEACPATVEGLLALWGEAA
jgi:hypothetical protein